jgi:hypothetical protein
MSEFEQWPHAVLEEDGYYGGNRGRVLIERPSEPLVSLHVPPGVARTWRFWRESMDPGIPFRIVTKYS